MSEPAPPLNPLIPRPIDRPTTVPLEPGASLEVLDGAKILAPPSDPALWPRFREVLEQWRTQARARFGEHRARYDEPTAAWAASCYVVAQVWLWDELLYSFDQQRFTPQRLIADAKERFGGFDGIVLWHAYPVIGIDERNQWAYYREVPRLAELVAELHRLGVRVFCDYNPWDTGTERGDTDAVELRGLIEDFGFDGVFLDTLKQGDAALIDPLFEANPGLALETESKLGIEDVGTHTMSWAQYFADSEPPGVLKLHWYERGHMQHHIRRWHRDHSEELQSAWLNGVGVMVWEVVFSAWVGWNARDAATLRRMRPVQRHWSEVLLRGEVTHLLELPEAVPGVYATRWRLGEQVLTALVNRSGRDVSVPGLDGWCLVSGRSAADGAVVPARSIGGVVCGPGAKELATECATVSAGSVSRFPYRSSRRLHRQSVAATGRLDTDDWLRVGEGVEYVTQRYRCRETGLYSEAPFVDEWKPMHPRLHDFRALEQLVLIPPMRVAPREVTVAEFVEFCEATGHTWPGCDGAADDPVTQVTLEEARAYATWRGARLPDEFEWQLALEGVERPGKRVWNWTESEHTDGRSRFVILKGGSDCAVSGSEWYVEHGRWGADYCLKYLRKGFDLDRNAWTGFRIAVDEEE